MTDTGASEREIGVDLPDGGRLPGTLAVPAAASGLVLFAHGSGSSRHSPRNRAVAAELQRSGIATVLIDLLTADEGAEDERTGQLRFDIGLLAERLMATTEWLDTEPAAQRLPLGYFGASTGAAAALTAAAQVGDRVSAVVSRGGRPDLAGTALDTVTAATLLIVGGRDETVLELNRNARDRLTAVARLQVVDGATHLFEEQGALEQVSGLAADWFRRHLGSTPGPPDGG